MVIGKRLNKEVTLTKKTGKFQNKVRLITMANNKKYVELLWYGKYDKIELDNKIPIR